MTDIWSEALAGLEPRLDRQTFDMWLRPIRLARVEGWRVQQPVEVLEEHQEDDRGGDDGGQGGENGEFSGDRIEVPFYIGIECTGGELSGEQAFPRQSHVHALEESE